MSHTRLRQDQTCLNCGKNVHDRFCSYCGQENREPHETFWSLLVHFLEDIFHYDGKLFTSIKQLFLKPGYLSIEYLRGKRTIYLHPIRFYLFTSAFFFICLFYVFSPLEKYIQGAEVKGKKAIANPISILKQGFQQGIHSNPQSYEAYKQEQAKLPVEQRDSQFEQMITKQGYALGKEYADPEALLEALVDSMLHKMSTLLFLTLPLLAFILQGVFFKRKGFYYMHHGIFVLHMATSYFIMLFGVEIFDIVELYTANVLFSRLSNYLLYAWIIYYFLAFKRFYQLTWLRSFPYFILSISLQQLFLALIFLGLLVFSLLSL